MGYEATYESIAAHAVPPWYHDAKLGIFVHWGLYSVPAWAPRGGDIREQVAALGWSHMFRNNPYAEWYQNTLRLEGTPTRAHHVATYGESFAYDDFAPLFQAASAAVDTDAWASLFARVGARYVVLTTKHHDGYLLWPSARTSPHRPGRYAIDRDLVGEVVGAARRQGLRAGLYYSGGLDWTFEERAVGDYMDVYSTIVQDPGFVAYSLGHWQELIDRYEPAMLWNDIGSPRALDLPALFASYYERIPDGLVNDRWGQELPDYVPGPGELINPPAARHHDFTTPEYASYDRLTTGKWEATRGIGHSYGYNQLEGPDDHLSIAQLVHHLVDIVSKNGSLLLNVGPMADGSIPSLQEERLRGLGDWLSVNGEAIFGTRPWVRAEGETVNGRAVRFTKKADTLCVTLLDGPVSDEVVIEGLAPTGPSTVRLLGHAGELAHPERGDDLAIGLPRGRSSSPALVIAISPLPRSDPAG